MIIRNEKNKYIEVFTMKYQKLFEKGQIGSVVLKNRIVMPAVGVSLATSTLEAGEDMIRYYEERAKGGCALIITEIARVDNEYGVGTHCQLSVTDPKVIPQLQRLVDTVHKYDTKILVQLHHPGRETKSALIGGKQIVAPSAVMCKVTGEMPRALTTEECEGIMKAFIKGAVISKAAGADGVEIHAAHGYLINQFLSPYTNKRTDKYGGSFHNRIRILEEIITGIRHLCGLDFLISVRISADEFVEGGLKLEDTIKITRTLESYGINVINVSSGIYESSLTIIEPGSYKQGWKKHLASTIKQSVKIPVIAVNNIKLPEVAEQLLDENVCDFVGIARGQLADPEWGNKSKYGKEDQIRNCIGCLHCFSELGKGGRIKCAVNPCLGREREFENIKRDGAGKEVAVIGGGPGGMEAARVLAQRNYKVTLFEKSDRLGGTLNIANKPPLKDKLTMLIDSMTAQVNAEKNIELKLNTEASVELVKKLNPVGVFIACGATPVVPKLSGIDSKKVVKAEDILNGSVKAEGRVAVIGSGMTGLETAEKLAMEGHEIAIVEMADEIGGSIYRTVLYDLMSRLQKHDPKLMPSHQLLAVTEKGVLLLNQKSAAEVTLEADTIVLALGVSPRRNLVASFEAAFDEVRVVGDALRGGRIVEAVNDGYTKAFVF